jgi:hypothetical protein
LQASGESSGAARLLPRIECGKDIKAPHMPTDDPSRYHRRQHNDQHR